jgi:Cu/Ag efflux pump CusA
MLSTSLTGTPGVKTIRNMSGFGFTMVFVIFKDNVEILLPAKHIPAGLDNNPGRG